ncbi:ADP-ribosylglycohydrolase family protein [bacterium]|nr:ADP-ribosylglycohydrolase family protein [bacterium]
MVYQNKDISVLDLNEKYSIGYALRTLAAALWCYWQVSSFEERLLAIVNEGCDANTNGDVACAILGAKFGYSSISRYYIKNLNNWAIYHKKITSFINQITDEKA